MASALINCYGCRVVTIAGGIVTCVGLILATYSPNVDVLILTYGGISGEYPGFPRGRQPVIRQNFP